MLFPNLYIKILNCKRLKSLPWKQMQCEEQLQHFSFQPVPASCMAHPVQVIYKNSIQT